MGGDVLALTGDLGAGKTLLTRGIALGLGIPADQVNSPTFTLIQAYDSPIPVIHVDLYRLEDPAAIVQLGLEDYFTDKTSSLLNGLIASSRLFHQIILKFIWNMATLKRLVI